MPCLHDDQFQVWDSLAICEYLHERHDGVWPADPQARAVARSVSAEMHSGFAAIRQAMPMNIKLRLGGRPLSDAEAMERDRIIIIWNTCRLTHGEGGEFLFGRFSAADAMFAPVIWRFETYNVILEGDAGVYQKTMLSLPAMQRWKKAALREGIVLSHYDSLADSFGGPR